MSRLANTIYRLLLRRLRTRRPSITYGELAVQVSRTIATHRRSRRFHDALTEVTITCRRWGLPAIPAIVWRADRAHPSDGYFALAHPRTRTEDGKLAAWRKEHDRVVRARDRYPGRL